MFGKCSISFLPLYPSVCFPLLVCKNLKGWSSFSSSRVLVLLLLLCFLFFRSALPTCPSFADAPQITVLFGTCYVVLDCLKYMIPPALQPSLYCYYGVCPLLEHILALFFPANFIPFIITNLSTHIDLLSHRQPGPSAKALRFDSSTLNHFMEAAFIHTLQQVNRETKCPG